MDNTDKILQEIFSTEVKSPRSYTEKIKETINLLEPIQRKSYNRNRLSLAVACCFVFLITGVVFAKDIEKVFVEKFRSLGKGVSTAVENGYVAKSEMTLIEKDMLLTNKKTGDVIDTIHTKAKIENAVLANGRIGIEVYFEFDSKLNNYINIGKNTVDGNIDYENSHHFEFNDIFVLDDKNNILALAPDGMEKCKNYFITNNLSYPNDNGANDIINSIINNIDNSDSSLIKTTVEIYFRYDETIQPKKLSLSLSEFNLIPKIENNENIEVNMKSDDNWFMEIDIPKELYDTTEEYYKVTKCENENFNVYTAKVTNTGFEIGIVVTNAEKPAYPFRMDEIFLSKEEVYSGDGTRDSYVNFYGEEFVELAENYYRQFSLIRYDGYVWGAPWLERTQGCYVTNSKGEKFIFDSRNHGNTEPPIKDKYYFNGCFSMTKFDATDKITVVIDFDGQPVHIELEKTNK